MEVIVEEDLKDSDQAVCGQCRDQLVRVEAFKKQYDELKASIKTVIQSSRLQQSSALRLRLRSPAALHTGLSPAPKRSRLPVRPASRKQLFPSSRPFQKLIDDLSAEPLVASPCVQHAIEFRSFRIPAPPSPSFDQQTSSPQYLVASPTTHFPETISSPAVADVHSPIQVS